MRRKVVSERIMRNEAEMRLRRNKTGPGACVLFTALYSSMYTEDLYKRGRP